MALSQFDAAISGEVLAFLDGGIGKSMGVGRDEIAAGLEFARSQLQHSPRDALRSYACLVVMTPLDRECQVGLANCALQVEEYAIALQAASAVVTLAPRDPRGYYLSARACFGLESFAEAIEDLADAAKFATEAGDAALFAACAKLSETIAVVGKSALEISAAS